MNINKILTVIGLLLFFSGMIGYLVSKYVFDLPEHLVSYVFIMACGLMACSKFKA